MNPMADVVRTFFNILDIEFSYGTVSFSLLDVVYASLLLTIFGLFIGKIIFFTLNKR